MFLSLHTMLHSYVHVTGNAGWAGVGWGGVGMLTFGWSWTRHWCYAEHGVGWGCERSFEVEHAIDATLSMGLGWGGVGMLTFVWSWTRHWCYAEHGVGWGGVGWGGDVNVQWVQKRLTVSMPGSINTFDPGNGDGKTRCVLTCWKNSTGLHAQWSLKLARQKKDRISCGRVAKRKKNDLLFKRVLLWDGYETLKRLSFFDHGDAPTRAIPHPAGYLSSDYLT